MTKEDNKGMEDLSASHVSHVSRKPLHWIHITTPYASHVVDVTFRNHYNAYDMFFNGTERGFLPVFPIEGKVLSYSNKYFCIVSNGPSTDQATASEDNINLKKIK